MTIGVYLLVVKCPCMLGAVDNGSSMGTAARRLIDWV